MKRNSWNARKKTGLLSTAVTLAVVVCLALVNAVAAVITERYPVKLDLTSGQVFRLSQQSVDAISGLQKPVEITVLNTKEGFTRGGDYYRQAMAVLEQYAQYNHGITLEFVDLAANPAYLSRYPGKDLSVNDILVACGDELRQLTVYDIFDVQMSWYGGTIAASKAEQAMTGAILDVTSDERPAAAFVTGHGEADASALRELLEKNGFETSEVSTLLEDPPADAALLVLAAPGRDFTQEEIAKLDAYLENGGAYGRNLWYFASLNQGELPNLEAWLAEWGLAVGQGAVAETDPRRVIGNNAFFGVADLEDTTLTESMQASGIPVAVPLSRPVEFLFSQNLGYATGTLLSYSESAGIAGLDVQQVSDVAPSGPVPVAGRSVLTRDGNASGVAVFGSDQMFAPDILGTGSLANADYLVAVASAMAGREDVFFVPSKTLGGGMLAVSQFQVLLFTLLLMVALPAGVLACGVAVWLRRRRR